MQFYQANYIFLLNFALRKIYHSPNHSFRFSLIINANYIKKTLHINYEYNSNQQN